MNSADNSPNKLAFWLLGTSVAAFVAVLCCIPSQANDLFWQLRTGHNIVVSHAIPHVDTFSWTRYGSPWVAQEWLSFVLFWIAYRFVGGLAGLLLLKMVLLSANLVILFVSMVRSAGGRLIPAFFLTILAVMSVSLGFEIRPQLFTYLFLTITISLLIAGRDNSYAQRKIWILVPIFLIWANLHSGVLVGLFLLVAMTIGDLVDGLFRRTEEDREGILARGKRLCALTFAAAAATLVTPYGISEYSDFLTTIHSGKAMNSVAEWASPTLHDSIGINFAMMSIVVAVGMIFSRRRVTTGDLIAIVVFFHAALMASRNIPLFALVGLPIAAPYLFSIVESRANNSTDVPARRSIFGSNPDVPAVILTSIGFVFIGFIAAYSHLVKSVDWSQGEINRANSADGDGTALKRLAQANIEWSTEPVRAAAFLSSGVFPANWRMYNDYDDGGFLIWQLQRYPVAIDGRADVYFGPVFDNCLKLNSKPYVWKSTLATFNPDFILSSRSDPQSILYMNSTDWALVYVDYPDMDRADTPSVPDNSFIFVRRLPANQSIIDKTRALCPALSSPDFRNKYALYPAVR